MSLRTATNLSTGISITAHLYDGQFQNYDQHSRHWSHLLPDRGLYLRFSTTPPGYLTVHDTRGTPESCTVRYLD